MRLIIHTRTEVLFTNSHVLNYLLNESTPCWQGSTIRVLYTLSDVSNALVADANLQLESETTDGPSRSATVIDRGDDGMVRNSSHASIGSGAGLNRALKKRKKSKLNGNFS